MSIRTYPFLPFDKIRSNNTPRLAFSSQSYMKGFYLTHIWYNLVNTELDKAEPTGIKTSKLNVEFWQIKHKAYSILPLYRSKSLLTQLPCFRKIYTHYNLTIPYQGTLSCHYPPSHPRQTTFYSKDRENIYPISFVMEVKTKQFKSSPKFYTFLYYYFYIYIVISVCVHI